MLCFCFLSEVLVTNRDVHCPVAWVNWLKLSKPFFKIWWVRGRPTAVKNKFPSNPFHFFEQDKISPHQKTVHRMTNLNVTIQHAGTGQGSQPRWWPTPREHLIVSLWNQFQILALGFWSSWNKIRVDESQLPNTCLLSSSLRIFQMVSIKERMMTPLAPLAE